MKKYILFLLLVFIGYEQGYALPSTFAPLAQKLSPAVVNIATTQLVQNKPPQAGPGGLPQFGPGSSLEDLLPYLFGRPQRPRKVHSLGSGFIVDPKGYVVTNNHVIAQADEISVILSNKKEYKAKIVGRDPRTDLALLKIETKESLPYVNWGDSKQVKVGDWILAIGNPFGLGGTVTAGIISSRARDIVSPGSSGYVDDYLQTDAAINVGNSGGPMFDMNGNVIGVNTAIYSPSGGNVGIGFAVPSEVARKTVEQIKQFGHPRHGWIGVKIQEVTKDIAESLNMKIAKGALVASVTPKGPAQAAGINSGDIIVEFDGKAVENSSRLPRMVGDTTIGKTVSLKILRRGNPVSLRIKIGEFQEAEKKGLIESDDTSSLGMDDSKALIEDLGFEVMNITPQLIQRFGLEKDTRGVLVSHVRMFSISAEKGLRPKDVISHINQQAVNTVKEVSAKVKEAKKQNRASILLQITRGKESHFVALKFDKK